MFNSFHTKEWKAIGSHLIVLDQTVFQNGLTDYELEVESTDAKEGRQFFLILFSKNMLYLLEKPVLKLGELKRISKNLLLISSMSMSIRILLNNHF